MNFIPDQPTAKTVVFFDDVNSEGGWQGHTTQKSIDTLKSEIVEAIIRLGGLVSGFQSGTFMIGNQKRDGFQIHYFLSEPNIRGRLDIAALPVKNEHSKRRSYDARRQKSLKMALFMTRNALDGMWFLQQLSPGYASLMPWILEEQTGKTITELWSEQAAYARILPPSDAESVEIS